MNKFLKKVYLFTFLDAFKLIGAIFTLFFAKNGLTPLEISLLIAIWSVTTLICEVPFGVLADKYPRREILIIAISLLIPAFVFWLKGGFVFYAFGFILWGMKNALVSGTLEAFIYDELKSYGREDYYGKALGKNESAFWIAVTLSAIFGSLIASINFQHVLYISILTGFLAIMTLFTIRPTKPAHSTGEKKYFALVKDALTEVKHNRIILQIITFFCLVFAAYGAAEEYWALLFQEFGVPTGLIGLLIATGYGAFVFASVSVSLFDTEKIKYIEYLLLVVSAVLFIFFGYAKDIGFIAIFFIALYLLKISHIRFNTLFQHSISSAQRATVTSLKSLVFEIVYIFFVLGYGLIATILGINAIPLILGILLIVLVIIFKLILDIRFGKVLSI